MGDRFIPAFPDIIDGWQGPVQWTPDVGSGDTAGLAYVLDTHRPEVQALLLHWLHAQGKPAHLLRPVWLGGFLTDEEAGQALAWSVRSVRAGGEPLKAVLNYLTRKERAAARAEGFATREKDGTIVFPPLLTS